MGIGGSALFRRLSQASLLRKLLAQAQKLVDYQSLFNGYSFSQYNEVVQTRSAGGFRDASRTLREISLTHVFKLL
jgi:hypothetical protein